MFYFVNLLLPDPFLKFVYTLWPDSSKYRGGLHPPGLDSPWTLCLARLAPFPIPALLAGTRAWTRGAAWHSELIKWTVKSQQEKLQWQRLGGGVGCAVPSPLLSKQHWKPAPTAPTPCKTQRSSEQWRGRALCSQQTLELNDQLSLIAQFFMWSQRGTAAACCVVYIVEYECLFFASHTSLLIWCSC